MPTEITLDSDQRRAVRASARAVVVVAGAGTGKTEVVARRVERLLQSSPDEAFRVLALSYTVKAADELKARFHERLGDLHRRVDTDTIHGFALSLLRKFGTRIGLPTEPEILTRDEDRAEVLMSWLEEGRHPDPLTSFDELFARLDLARARCEPAPYLEEWREALDGAGALDFPSMLDRACELLEGSWAQRHLQRLYDHVIVDEAQNLTPAQYELIRRVIGEPGSDHLNVVIVGDERQSIVTFAGADPELISRFAKEYDAERIELHRNYRSAERIIQVGRSIAEALEQPTPPFGAEYAALGTIELAEAEDEPAEGRLVADWVSSLLEGGLDEAAVAPGESVRIQPEEIACLSRSGAALRYTREALNERSIENASASTEDDWVRSVAARLLVEIAAFHSAPDHRSTQRRMESILGNSESTWDDPQSVLVDSGRPELAQFFGSQDPMDLLEVANGIDIDDPDWSDDLQQLNDAMQLFVDRTDVADRTFGNFRQHIARCQRGDSLDPGVRLLTVHKAQGQEFRAVAVIACNEGQFPDFRAETEEELTSELRTFYVAVSRPTRMLLLTRALSRSTRFGSRRTASSKFLGYLPRSVLHA